jgi:hypothetical protein
MDQRVVTFCILHYADDRERSCPRHSHRKQYHADQRVGTPAKLVYLSSISTPKSSRTRCLAVLRARRPDFVIP